MKVLRFILQETLVSRLKKFYLEKLNWRTPEKVVWLVGMGRSGTTWVSSVINWRKDYREVFEPVHPIRGNRFSSMPKHYYKSETIDKYNKILSKILKGRYSSIFTDDSFKTFLLKRILVKDIFANLLLFNSVTLEKCYPVLLIRNPFDVAKSRKRTEDWGWELTPLTLLNQEKLADDYLNDYRDLIIETENRGSFLEKQVLIWCIINMIPILQFSTSNLKVIYYEDIKASPMKFLKEINDFLGDETNCLPTRNELNVVINKVSKVSYQGNKFVEFSSREIINSKRILDIFGFSEIYPDQDSFSKISQHKLKSIISKKNEQWKII